MMTRTLSLFLLVLFASPQVSAKDVPPEVIQAAEEGLPIFLSGITPEVMEDFGFSNNDNLDDAVLGRPFQEYFISKTVIENYSEGNNIYDVLTAPIMWYFPIMISDEIKCLLGIDKMDGNWEAVFIGYAPIAQLVALARQVWPISEGTR